MKKLSLILSVLISNVAIAQTTSISGKLLDKTTNEALQYANVQIYSLPDSTFLKGDVTKEDGSFKIEGIKAEKCLVRASFIGYIPVDKNINVVKGQDNSVGRILLLEDSKQLAEVSITAEATPMTVRDDTVVFNADAFHVVEGAALEDLVKKLPGAEISDGKVTVNGKTVSKVLMDGKEFYSSDPMVALKNLPANMVKDAKTYDKRSEQAELTGIDDDDEEFVLDFTVRKGFKDGWVGKIWGAGGHDIGGEDDFRYDGHVDLNKFNDEGNFSITANVNNTNNASMMDDAMSSMSSGSAGGSGGGNRGGGGGFGGGGGGGMMGGGMMGGGMDMGMMDFGSFDMASMFGGVTTSATLGLSFAQEPSKTLKYGGDLNYSHQEKDTRSESTRENFLSGRTTLETGLSSSIRTSDMVRASFRLNWGIDSMTTIIFRPNVSFNYSNTDSDGDSDTFGAVDSVRYNRGDSVFRDLVSTTTTFGDQKSTSLSYGMNLRVVRKLNNNGRSLTLGVNLNGSLAPSENHRGTNAKYHLLNDSTLNTLRYTDGDRGSFSIRAEISYVEPIFEKNYLQLRYSYQNQNSDSYSLVYEGDSVGNNIEYNNDYTELLSSKVENTYENHRAEVIWQGRYDKLRYNLGVSLQPQHSKVDNLVGQNKGNNYDQTVFNWAPSMRLEYRFTSTQNLQFRYNGRSSAPSVQNLQEVINVSNPQRLQYGNPNLKPSFRNNISLSFSNFNRTTYRNFIVNLSYNNTMNNTTTVTYYDLMTGNTITELENYSGNWGANGFLTFSTPLSNQKFSITSRSMANYSENGTLTGEIVNGKADHNTKKESITSSLILSETLQANYRTDVFDFSIDGSIMYQKSDNANTSLSNNGETFNYTIGFDGNLHLPAKIDLSTDLNYRIYQGYGENSNQRNTAIWNAQLSKRFTESNSWTVRFKIYDILQQQKLISRNVSSTSVYDSETNTIGCYAMVQVVYNINTLGKKGGNQRGGFPGGFGPGGFPGGFGGPF